MGSFVGPKSIMHALLLLFLLQSMGLVHGGVDITIYASIAGCSGSGFACTRIAPGECCYNANAGGAVSVITSFGPECLGANYFSQGSCSTGINLGTTSGNFCYYNGIFNAASWFTKCHRRRRSLLGEHESKTLATCTGQTKPNAVVFTEDGTQGHWVLSSSNAMEIYSQLQNVNDAEKLDWIKSKGATYKELDSTIVIGTQEVQD